MSTAKNKRRFLSAFFVLFALFGFLPGCSYKQTKKAVQQLSSESANFSQTKQNITVRVKELDSKELVELFGNKAKNLSVRKRKSKYHRSRKKVGVHTLQLAITNKSLQPIYLDKKSVDLNLIKCKRVAYALRKNIFLGSTATKIAGVTGLGLIAAGAAFAASGLMSTAVCPCCVLVPVYIGAVLATPGVFLTCTSTVGHFQRKHANKVNKQTFSDVTRKSISNQLVIHPGETKDILLFVDEENYKEQFDITLVNKTQSKHIFTVVL